MGWLNGRGECNGLADYQHFGRTWLPWLIACMAGQQVSVKNHAKLQEMAYLQAVNVGVYTTLILVTIAHTWRPGDHSKAALGRNKGAVLIVMYLVSLVAYAMLLSVGR